jgi:uncharacterized membrane protein YhaH (DUF805 family)
MLTNVLFILKKHTIMTFGESIKTCFSKYATFEGRASLSEYWWFFLFQFIVGLAIGWIPFIGWIVSLGFLIPNLAVGVRRLHDTGRSGLNYLWVLLPLIGSILLLIYLIGESDVDNKWGPKPMD